MAPLNYLQTPLMTMTPDTLDQLVHLRCLLDPILELSTPTCEGIATPLDAYRRGCSSASNYIRMDPAAGGKGRLATSRPSHGRRVRTAAVGGDSALGSLAAALLQRVFSGVF